MAGTPVSQTFSASSNWEEIRSKLLGRCILGSIRLLEGTIRQQLQTAQNICQDQKKLFDLPPEVTLQNCTSAIVVRFSVLQLARHGEEIINRAESFLHDWRDLKAISEVKEYWKQVMEIVSKTYDACEQCFMRRYGTTFC